MALEFIEMQLEKTVAVSGKMERGPGG